MREDAVRQFLLELGVDSDDIEDTGRGWLNALCPLAPYTHAGGEDKRPSFGVSISDEQRSVYYCFGCSPEPKRLDTLLHSVWLNSGLYPYDAARLYMAHENHWAGRPTAEVPDAWRNYEERVEDQPLPGWVLKKFPVLQHSKGFEQAGEGVPAGRTWDHGMGDVFVHDPPQSAQCVDHIPVDGP